MNTVVDSIIILQNGTTEEVKKIVTTLNEAQVPSGDVVGMFGNPRSLNELRYP